MTEQRPVLNQFNLIVEDMERSVAFYRLLGLTFSDTAPAWQPHHRSATHESGLTLEIDSVAFARTWNRGWRSGGGAGGGMGVLGFGLPTRDAVDAVYDRMVRAGHRGQQAPYDAFWGSRFAVVEDPDGNAVGLMSAPEDGFRGVATGPAGPYWLAGASTVGHRPVSSTGRRDRPDPVCVVGVSNPQEKSTSRWREMLTHQPAWSSSSAPESSRRTMVNLLMMRWPPSWSR